MIWCNGLVDSLEDEGKVGALISRVGQRCLKQGQVIKGEDGSAAGQR